MSELVGLLPQSLFERLAGYEDVNDADRLCRDPAIPKAAEPWLLTSLREKLINISAKVVRHGRCTTFEIATVAVSRQMLKDIMMHRPAAGPTCASMMRSAELVRSDRRRRQRCTSMNTKLQVAAS